MNLVPVTVELFLKYVDAGVEAWENAGRALVQLIDQNPGVIEKILERRPNIRRSTIRAFERIGRGTLLAEVEYSKHPGIKLLGRLGIAEQRKFLKEPVDVLIRKGSELITLKAKVENLLPKQRRQVFAGDHIRSVGEQRLYLESKDAEPKSIDLDRPYRVRRGEVVITAPCRLTVQQLLVLLTEAAR